MSSNPFRGSSRSHRSSVSSFDTMRSSRTNSTFDPVMSRAFDTLDRSDRTLREHSRLGTSTTGGSSSFSSSRTSSRSHGPPTSYRGSSMSTSSRAHGPPTSYRESQMNNRSSVSVIRNGDELSPPSYSGRTRTGSVSGSSRLTSSSSQTLRPEDSASNISSRTIRADQQMVPYGDYGMIPTPSRASSLSHHSSRSMSSRALAMRGDQTDISRTMDRFSSRDRDKVNITINGNRGSRVQINIR